MDKLVAIIQLIGSALVSIVVMFTLVNLFYISQREETISVVNTLIGQGVLSICLLVMARVLFKKGVAGLKQNKAVENSDPAA